MMVPFAGAIPYPELLAYAQSLSAFTSAPPNLPEVSLPGQPTPPLFFPPFPNEEKMRRGHLNSEEPLVTSDRGIIMLRRLLLEQIRAVGTGTDPIGVNFDPDKQIVAIPSGNFYDD